MTLPSHVGDADNAEFMLIGLYGGIAHPPGYPIYVLCLRLFSNLSFLFDSPVFALSLFSCICVGGAGALYCKFLQRFGTPVWVSVMATLWVFLSLPIWRMGNFVEPFGLHFLIIIAMMFQLQTWVRTDTSRAVLGLGFCWGLGFCNHHTLVFMMPMVFALAVLRKRNLKEWQHITFYFAGGFLLGLLPLVAFFMVAADAPWIWGDWSSWERIGAHLFRTEYGTFQLVPHQPGSTTLGWVAFFKSLPVGLGYIALLLIGLGLLRGLIESVSREQRVWIFGHWICFALYFVFFLGALNVGTDDPTFTVIQRFLGEAYLLLGLFLAIGMSSASRHYGKVGNPKMVPALLSIVLISQIFFTFPLAQRGDEDFIQAHGENILSLTQEGDVLIVNNDVETFVLTYLNHLEETPRVVFSVPMYNMPWYRSRLAAQLKTPVDQMPASPMDLIKKLNHTRRILLVEPQKMGQDPWVMERFFPLGPIWCIAVGSQQPPDPQVLFKLNKQFLEKRAVLSREPSLPKSRIEKELFGKYQVPWLILCDSLKSLGAGEMHEACSLKKAFQRKLSL